MEEKGYGGYCMLAVSEWRCVFVCVAGAEQMETIRPRNLAPKSGHILSGVPGKFLVELTAFWWIILHVKKKESTAIHCSLFSPYFQVLLERTSSSNVIQLLPGPHCDNIFFHSEQKNYNRSNRECCKNSNSHDAFWENRKRNSSSPSRLMLLI